MTVPEEQHWATYNINVTVSSALASDKLKCHNEQIRTRSTPLEAQSPPSSHKHKKTKERPTQTEITKKLSFVLTGKHGLVNLAFAKKKIVNLPNAYLTFDIEPVTNTSSPTEQKTHVKGSRNWCYCLTFFFFSAFFLFHRTFAVKHWPQICGQVIWVGKISPTVL